MKKITLIVVLVAVFTLAIAISPVSACYDCGPGVGTPGYWKNHPEAWPVDEIEIGYVMYTKAEAIAIMNLPVKGDKSITMFKAAVATSLNLAIGNCNECDIHVVLWEANNWLFYNPPGSGVKADGEAWQSAIECLWDSGEAIYWMLDDYNNGLLCAAPRD